MKMIKCHQWCVFAVIVYGAYDFTHQGLDGYLCQRHPLWMPYRYPMCSVANGCADVFGYYRSHLVVKRAISSADNPVNSDIVPISIPLASIARTISVRPCSMPFSMPFSMPCSMPFSMPCSIPFFIPSSIPFSIPFSIPRSIPLISAVCITLYQSR